MVTNNQQQNIPSQPRSKLGRAATIFAMLGGPLTWAAHFVVMYFLVQPVCRLGGEITFHIATIIGVAITIAAGFVAWQHREPKGSFTELIGRLDNWRAFVAFFGVAQAVMFTYAIAYQWVPVVQFGACEGMRPLQ